MTYWIAVCHPSHERRATASSKIEVEVRIPAEIGTDWRDVWQQQQAVEAA